MYRAFVSYLHVPACIVVRVSVYLTCDQICIASYCRVSPRIDVYFVVSTLTAGRGAQAASITGTSTSGKSTCIHMYRRVSSAHQERRIDMYRRVSSAHQERACIDMYRACIEKVKSGVLRTSRMY